MKSIFVFLILLAVSSFANSQNIFNSVTREKLKKEDGVVVQVSATLATITKDCTYYPFWRYWRCSWTVSVSSVNRTYSYDGEPIYFGLNSVQSYKVTISAPYYETVTFSAENFPVKPGTRWGDFSINGTYTDSNGNESKITEYSPPPLESDGRDNYVNLNDVYLVPKKQVIEGEIKITNQAASDLGLLTAKSIAEGLGISEEDVIKLITSQQLKGKKIGDKYFIRKEDFDAFMKK